MSQGQPFSCWDMMKVQCRDFQTVKLWGEHTGEPQGCVREPLNLGWLLKHGGPSCSGEPALLLDESSMEGSWKISWVKKELICLQMFFFPLCSPKLPQPSFINSNYGILQRFQKTTTTFSSQIPFAAGCRVMSLHWFHYALFVWEAYLLWQSTGHYVVTHPWFPFLLL